jgi:hypothetical protein
MVSIEGIIDFIAIRLDDTFKIGKYLFWTGLIPALSVVNEHKPVYGGMVQPHVALKDAIFMISIQYFYGTFIHLDLIMGENDQAKQHPERF